MSARAISIFFLAVLSLADSGKALADGDSTNTNGLYYVSSSATGEAVKADDESSVSLVKKAEIQIHHAYVYSENNANTDFTVRLDTSAYGADPNSGAVTKPVVLRIGNRGYSWSGGGGSKGAYNLMFFRIHDGNEAEAAAKGLSVDCVLRNPPGYRFSAQFVPTQTKFHTNEPVLVKFLIKNLDERTIVFQKGGQQRGARDNQYGFRAILNQVPVADTGNPVNFGGLYTSVRLEPGKESSDQIDLRKWFSFDKAGTYFIHGFYQMDFFSPAEAKESLSPWNKIWSDYASADFEVVVK